MPPRVVNQFMAKIFVLHLLLAFYNKYADKNVYSRPNNENSNHGNRFFHRATQYNAAADVSTTISLLFYCVILVKMQKEGRWQQHIRYKFHHNVYCWPNLEWWNSPPNNTRCLYLSSRALLLIMLLSILFQHHLAMLLAKVGKTESQYLQIFKVAYSAFTFLLQLCY